MRYSRVAVLSVLVSILGAPATPAQQPAADCPLHAAPAKGETVERSPYAGEETRPIKALSADQRQQLLDGHGMGLARVAELNHYPGPKHVLELAASLDLTDEQTRKTRAIFDEMRERAQALGREIIEAESALDVRFATRTIDEAGLVAAVGAIGRLQADLRVAHLRAHLQMKAELTPEQSRLYDELRGYEVSGARP